MKLTEYIAITLNEKTCLSVCRRRQCPTEKERPVGDTAGRPVGDTAGRPAEQSSQDAQSGTLLDKQKERILAECQAVINRQKFISLMTEEVYENWVKLLNLNKKNFIVLKQKNHVDKIINFFMNSY